MSLKLADSLDRLDSWQQRRPALAIPVAVIKKFSDDGADRLGVQIAYWGFFSIFALLLVFTSVLGFVFDSNPDLQRQLLDSTPGAYARDRAADQRAHRHAHRQRRGAGGRCRRGALDRSRRDAGDRHGARSNLGRPGREAARFCQLAVAGAPRPPVDRDVTVLATVAVAVAPAGGVGATVTQVLGVLASAVIDLVLFVASFRLLTAATVTTRELLPGALLAAGCWLALQALGGVFVTQVLAGSSQPYGGFAAVIGFFSWLLLASELILIAAELNVVLARRLWPRSLTGELLGPRQAGAASLGTCRPT